MMNNFKRTCITRPLLAGVTLGVILASSVTSASALDLLQAYNAAQTQDATLLAARAAAQAGRERIPQARSQLMPNVAINLSATHNQLSSTTTNFFGQEQIGEASYPSGNQALVIRQPLYRPQLTAQLRQARAQVQDVEALLAQEEQALVVRVSGAYFDALSAYEQLDIVIAQLATYTTQLDAARKMFAAGSGTRTDVDEALARLDQTSASEIEARQNVTFTLQQLQTMVKQPVDKLARLDAQRFDQMDSKTDSLQSWVDRAEGASPQLQSLNAQVEVARQEIDKARAGHYPTLDAVAQLSRSESDSVTNLRSTYTNTTIGVQLSIPIFSGGSVNSAVRQALAGQERAEQALEAAKRDLGVRVFKEYRGMTDSVAKIKALEQAVRSADQLVLSSSKSFQAGSRTLVDVSNAQQQRLVVLRELAQTRFVHLASRLRLQALAGAADVGAVSAVNSLLQH